MVARNIAEILEKNCVLSEKHKQKETNHNIRINVDYVPPPPNDYTGDFY